jgi:2-hydroxychromene-2-carboxylate isomerase
MQHQSGKLDRAEERRAGESQRRATFYYDFNSPYSYLAAERISAVFSEAGCEQPAWQPISFGHVVQAIGKTPWSMQPEGPDPGDLEEARRRAAERGLPEVVYPKGWPVENYSLNPTRAAIYAKESGRVVSFSLACFRQVFAAGRDMSDIDNVLLAAAACELHPNAVLKGIETKSVKEELKRATNEAIELGVTGIPTVSVAGELFWGDERLEDAAKVAFVD